MHDPGASTARTLVFRYRVHAGDTDADGIGVGDETSTFRVGIADGIVTASTRVNAILDHAVQGTLPAHKVDATRTDAAKVTTVEVSSTPPLSSDYYGLNDRIEFTVTFDKDVRVTAPLAFRFEFRSPGENTVRVARHEASASTARKLVFRHVVGSVAERFRNDAHQGLHVGDHTSTFGDGGTESVVTVSNGLPAILDHTALALLTGHKVDTARPGAAAGATVSSVAVTSTPSLTAQGSSVMDLYGAGETIELTVTFDREVLVRGTPELVFSLADAGNMSERRAAYDAVASKATTQASAKSTRAVFRYTVLAADADDDGISLDGNPLRLDGDDAIVTASYDDFAANAAAVLDWSGAGTQSGHKVDGAQAGASLVPGAPQGLAAVPGDGRVRLTWSAGPSVTRYQHRHHRGAAVPESAPWRDVPDRLADSDLGNETEVTVTGLDNAAAYAFEVRAVNAEGWSAPAAVTATPVGLACNAPGTAGRRVIWSGTLGVAQLEDAGNPSGYGFDAAARAGSLPGAEFAIGANAYRIAAVRVKDFSDDATDGNLVVRLTAGTLSAAERAALTLHVCGAAYRFDAATARPAEHEYEWAGSLDWSGPSRRMLRLTLPAQSIATGKPAIAGPASPGAGTRASAVTTAIEDLDGVADTFAYQWVRVDEGGVSNRMNIPGATGASYVLGAADIGKQLLLVVRYVDGQGTTETLTSDPWPSGATILANEVPATSDAAVTVAEDATHTFTAADFPFTDADTGAALAHVRVVTVPRAGRLALDGAPVGLGTVVTKARLDAGGLEFEPTPNSNGTGYAGFDFRVSDGVAESAPATLTINVTPVDDPTTGAPAVLGAPRVGRPLTASPGDLADIDGLPDAFDWQWVRVDGMDAADISGATAMTFSPDSADQGKKLRVKALFTDGGGTSVTVSSTDTGTVQAAAPDGGNATGRPNHVSGEPFVGEEVEFSNGAVGDPDGLSRAGIQLQWLRCDSGGANCDTVIAVGDKYTLTAAEVGLRLRVRANFVDNDGNYEARVSYPWPSRSKDPIRDYPPCEVTEIENLVAQDRRVIFSGTMTVGSGNVGGPNRAAYGYSVRTPASERPEGHFGGFGSFSPSSPVFESSPYRYRLVAIYRGGPSESVTNIGDLLVRLHDPREGRLVRITPAGHSHLRQHVQLHVCNRTFPFNRSTWSSAVKGYNYLWEQPGIYFQPGTTRIVRLSERIADPTLRDLRLSEGTLSPVFRAEHTRYTAVVEEPVERLAVMARSHNPGAAVRFLDEDGQGILDMDPTDPDDLDTDLDLGDNVIKVEVTDQDGRTKRTYTTIVTRDLSSDATLKSLALSAGTLTPIFSPATTSYTATVGSDGPRIVTVSAAANHAAATLAYLDGTDAVLADADPATPDTFEVDLAVGENVVKVKVTAQDGTTMRTYTTTVTRQVSNDASLKALDLSRGTLAPVFSPGHLSYTATVGVNTERRITLTPVPNHRSATLAYLDGADAVLADADPATPDTFEANLVVGENVVKVKVTAENGTTMRTYTTTITAVELPEVSIAALHPKAAPALALPEFRVTVSEAPAQPLAVTLTFTQDAPWLASTTHTVTIPAGATSATEKLALSTDLSLASGNLTATIADGGLAYLAVPAPGNAATVEVVVADPLLTAVWAEDAYTVAEGESVTLEARVRTADGVPRPREDFAVAVSALAGTAVSGTDYTAIPDTTFTVAPGDWTEDGAAFTETLSLEVETLDDTSLEGDETVHVRLAAASGHLAPGLDCDDADLVNLGEDNLTSCATKVTIDDDETLSVTGGDGHLDPGAPATPTSPPRRFSSPPRSPPR